MSHSLSIFSFIYFFGLGFIGFVIAGQLWRLARRLRLFAVVRRWLFGATKPLFITVYRDQETNS